LILLAVQGCVWNPEKTVEYSYGTLLIGTSIDVINDEMRMGPPLSIFTNEQGMQVYTYALPRHHPEKGTILYEVVDGKIVSMTHQGQFCKIYN